MTYNALRNFIMAGWGTTIAAVAAAYVFALVAEPIRPDTSLLMTNMAAVIGLVAPHLTMVYDFFFSHEPRIRKKLPKGAAYMIVSMCSLYWVLLTGAVWLGMAFRIFSPLPDGHGIETTTSVALALAGMLSFLAVKPTTKLFLLSQTATESARPAAPPGAR